jgi:hypothetical protein
MKFLFSFLILSFIILQSCGPAENNSDAPVPPEIKIQDSSVPHVVINGKKASYAFPPDSCISNLVIGNADSFKIFRRENGAFANRINPEMVSMSYYNISHKEEMQVLVTGNERKGYFPYSLIVQSADSHSSHLFPGKHEQANKGHFISGHGIYLNMSSEFLLGIYKSQELLQWKKGDTLYLQYTPGKKDEKYFTRYDYSSYSATYKFVGDFLVRMEYEVHPGEFERNIHP